MRCVLKATEDLKASDLPSNTTLISLTPTEADKTIAPEGSSSSSSPYFLIPTMQLPYFSKRTINNAF